jgi:hypothetical protein
MYPQSISPDTCSNAERQLFAALEEQLSDAYHVFHSVAWQALNKEGKPYDGEADFVIAHARLGILVLEVKGGGIAFDAEKNTWTSTDQGGKTHHIKDAFGQATDSKYKLRNCLDSMLGAAAHRLTMGHAVAFPDVVVDQQLPGMNKPREIVLDMRDKETLDDWMQSSFAYYRGNASQQKQEDGDASLRALKKLLGTGFLLPMPRWGIFTEETKEFIQLTQQQYIILDTLNRQRRALISGFAGSGKTMLAVEKATRLAEQGFRVLLTCYNRNLATDLREKVQPASNLDINNFHALCLDLLQELQTVPAGERNQHFFDTILPEALEESTDRIDVRYDAIIVDEGQDFQDDWWLPLQLLLRDPDHGILYIFYDDNQRIYVNKGNFPIGGEPYLLSVNCRNTRTIHEQIVRCYRGSVEPVSRGPAGRAIEKVLVPATNNLYRSLMRLLRQLINEDRIPTDEIVILTPRSKQKSLLWAKSGNSPFSLTESWPPSPNQIYCTTIHSFKGLERSVVIVAELERWQEGQGDLEYLVYVACSRARNHLIVLLAEEESEKIQELFA